MCDNCSAVVGEYKRQTYRLRVMLCIERGGYKTNGMNIAALQKVVEEFNLKVLAGDCAEKLMGNANQYGLVKRGQHENYSVNS